MSDPVSPPPKMYDPPPSSSIFDPSRTFSRGRSQTTDDETMTASAISTDLSHYMANFDRSAASSSFHCSDPIDSDVDSDTTTIAESMFQSICENAPDDDVISSSSGLIRSASFTVDSPTFDLSACDQTIPAVDSRDQSIIGLDSDKLLLGLDRATDKLGSNSNGDRRLAIDKVLSDATDKAPVVDADQGLLITSDYPPPLIQSDKAPSISVLTDKDTSTSVLADNSPRIGSTATDKTDMTLPNFTGTDKRLWTCATDKHLLASAAGTDKILRPVITTRTGKTSLISSTGTDKAMIAHTTDKTALSPATATDTPSSIISSADKRISTARTDMPIELTSRTDKPKPTLPSTIDSTARNSESWSEDFLNEQIQRLEEMTLSLRHYHRSQLDELIARQSQESETLRLQKEFLQSVVRKNRSIDRRNPEESSIRSTIAESTTKQSRSNQSKNRTEPIEKTRPTSEYFRPPRRSIDVADQNRFGGSYRSLPRSPPPSSSMQSSEQFATATKSTPTLSKSDPGQPELMSLLFGGTAVESENGRRSIGGGIENRVIRSTAIGTIDNSGTIGDRSISTDRKRTVIRMAFRKVPEVLRRKLPAWIRGYLIRRWIRTEKIAKVINTIKDLQHQLTSLESEGSLGIVDEHFKRVLTYQLRCSKLEFSRILESPLSDRLETISDDRHRSKELERRRSRRARNQDDEDESHPFGLLSSATLKSLTRKTTTRGPSRGPSRASTIASPAAHRGFASTPTPRRPTVHSSLSLASTSASTPPPARGHRRNIMRVSPRPKSTYPSLGTVASRRRKRGPSPSICLVRSPRPNIATTARRSKSAKPTAFVHDHDPDDDLTNSSTTMNFRMTMNTQRWSGFCHLDHVHQPGATIPSNRKPWR